MKSEYMGIILTLLRRELPTEILFTASQSICELHMQWSATVTQPHSHKAAASFVCESTLIPPTLCSHMLISLTSAVFLRIQVFRDMIPCCWISGFWSVYVPSKLWKPLTQQNSMNPQFNIHYATLRRNSRANLDGMWGAHRHRAWHISSSSPC